jgi:nucleoside phosphorylase
MDPVPLVYIFASSKMEAKPVLALARKNVPVQRGLADRVEVGENRFAVIITGMGTGSAQASADAALAADGARPPTQKPDAILVIGLCGGLTGAMREGQIVAYTQCFSTQESPAIRCSEALTDTITGILEKHRINCDAVTGITSPRFACNRSEKLALARTGVSVMDMESYQILSAAARVGIPASVLRVVCDPLEIDMPDFNPALDAKCGLILSRAMWIALASPLATWRLFSSSQRAMARLTAAAKLILQSDCFGNLRSTVGDC